MQQLLLDNTQQLTASLAHLAFIIISCQIFRFLKNAFISNRLIWICVEEFISTLQLCVSNFELGVITEVYGLSGYAIGLFITSATYSLTFEDGTADPSECLDKYCKKTIGGKEFVMRSVFSLTAAALSYRTSKVFWSMKMSPVHLSSFEGVGECTASLQVPLALGIFFEGTETFLNRIVQNMNGFNMITGGMSDVAITFFGLLVTGGYFNPSLALAMEFGCKGLSFSDYVVIYAIGPAVGTLVALQIGPKIIRLVESEANVEPPKTTATRKPSMAQETNLRQKKD